MKRNIIFTRKASLRGIAMKYGILLNGKEIGRLGSGQTIRVSVQEGTYTLTLKPHPGVMVQSFGPYTVMVGSRDVNVWVDTSQDAFVCKITGAENDSKFPEWKESMCRKLADLTVAEAQRMLPCYYSMEQDHVLLKAVHGGRVLQRVFYFELSNYEVSKLERWQRQEMAEAFGLELNLSGRVSRAWVHVAGACVNLDEK